MGNKIAVLYFERNDINLDKEFQNLRERIGVSIPDDNNIEYCPDSNYVAAEISGIWLGLYPDYIVEQRLNDFIKGAKLLLEKNNIPYIGKNIFFLSM